ncbi:sulfatase [Actinoplanes sp. TFC3]|uniref:sulfatase n=1 Tax=Actinoplanes sp. TFC3 TaxID=1710355 RepID=UPI000830AA3E|nr:sulfatase [Actinoplanes sp. TFC3]
MSSPHRPRRWPLTAFAAVVVFLALVVPEQITRLPAGTPVWRALVRVPLEAIAVFTLLLVLPRRARGIVAGVLGAVLGMLTVLKVIDGGFFAALARSFDPVLDWPLFADGYRFVRDSSGAAVAVIAVVVAAGAAVGVPVAMVWAMRRLAAAADRHRLASRRSLLAAALAWLLLAVSGTSFVPGVYAASDTAVALARDSIGTVPAALRDKREFAAQTADDAFAAVPGDQLLTGLRGKDVLLMFVESYGRDALDTAPVRTALAGGTKQLAAHGFAARSGFLQSPTAGGGSWLAHSTLQSGVWIDNQQRYRSLVSGDRLTLTSAFAKAGAWRTVGVEPGVTYAWPEGTFYGYDHVYDSHTLSYHGPAFSWSTMPDQFTLKSFTDQEYHRPGRAPLMAEITFVSSHTPWSPLPTLIGWDQVGDGSVYTQQHAYATPTSQVWPDTVKIRSAYAQSITYSLDSLISWVSTYGDDNLVLVFLGDHQPAPVVVGDHATHDVPITVLAHDRRVLGRMAGWGWSEGLQPAPNAPVWPMNAFRDRFLTAFGPASVSRPLSPPR